MTDAVIMLASLFGAIALGVPIPMAVALACVVGIWLVDLPMIFIAQSMYDALEGIPLMTIPLFVLAGALMEKAGMALRLVNVAQALVGRHRGSLGLVAIVGCTFFAALSGSAPATTAAIGAATLPAMMRQSYAPAFGGAVVASGGALGSLIPPSNLMIIYGIVSENSIPRLFLAGILPGVAASLLMMLTVWLIARHRGYGGSDDPFSWGRVAGALWEAKWALAAPVIILGGIYTGIFTTTEAASVAVAYSLLVGFAIYRDLKPADLLHCLKTTALISGTVVIILGPAKAFGQLVSIMQIPEMLGGLLGGAGENAILTILIITIVLVITGMFLESIAQIILFTPLLLPIVVPLGVDPIVFGVIMVLACEIGFLTPPVGVNLFVAARLTGLGVEQISVAVIPFLFVFLFLILALAIFPQVVLFLPDMIYGRSP